MMNVEYKFNFINPSNITNIPRSEISTNYILHIACVEEFMLFQTIRRISSRN
jgi:hypothetical protein